MEERKVLNLDQAFNIMLDFLESTLCSSIAFAQGGDYIGGKNGRNGRKLWMQRKVMNSFFCCTERPFPWYGRLNDDVNTFLVNGNRGLIFGTIFSLCLEQERTQGNSGGLTDLYLQHGTYVKSFYSVMFGPSYVKVYPDHAMSRIHHRINWNAAVPKIMSEEYHKA